MMKVSLCDCKKNSSHQRLIFSAMTARGEQAWQALELHRENYHKQCVTGL